MNGADIPGRRPGSGWRAGKGRAGSGRGGRGRTTALTAGAVLCAVLLSACGVRTTSVPVDAGAAPSRPPCEVDQKDVVPSSAAGDVPVRVYLACASALTAVERVVHVRAHARVPIAQALLGELRARPPADEHEAGLTTYVESPLSVTEGRRGDPVGTLRLSAQPEDLPQAALAQIVCTFAGNGVGAEGRAAASGDVAGVVVLGGPGAYAPRAYVCDSQVKADPDAPVPAATPSTGAAS